MERPIPLPTVTAAAEDAQVVQVICAAGRQWHEMVDLEWRPLGAAGIAPLPPLHEDRVPNPLGKPMPDVFPPNLGRLGIDEGGLILTFLELLAELLRRAGITCGGEPRQRLTPDAKEQAVEAVHQRASRRTARLCSRVTRRLRGSGKFWWLFGSHPTLACGPEGPTIRTDGELMLSGVTPDKREVGSSTLPRPMSFPCCCKAFPSPCNPG